MSFYEINLAILIVVNGLLYLYQRRRANKRARQALNIVDEKPHDAAILIRWFLIRYLVAYLLAMGSDWMQGPHIYAMYRYDKGLEETTTAALYATGFVAGAVSSAFVGQFADKHGRRSACVSFCVTYLLCCISMLSNQLWILFIGRICGGIGTTLLYTSFESWMMTEYYSSAMDDLGLSTATVFGLQTTLNSVVAILSGVIGEVLVSLTGSRKSPFMFAGLLAVLSASWMLTHWAENHGRWREAGTSTSASEIVTAARNIWQEKSIFALTVASSIFEAMMYLFVFFWSAAITSPRAAAGDTAAPPYGTIFSCFMCAMMAGSQVFSMLSTNCKVSRAATILEVAMTLASFALVSTVLAAGEGLIFWAFCAVELCVGLYFPSMSYLKGNLIEDGSRAKLYSLMRLPLNVLVVLTHTLAEEGDHHRRNVFMTFGAGAVIAFIVVRRFVE